VVERLNPVEHTVEKEIDVPYVHVIERIRPVETIREEFVDVAVEHVIERIRPVAAVVERFVDETAPVALAAAAGAGAGASASRGATVAAPGKPPKSDAARDDLKRVEGIGPKIEELFHKRGIYTFAALAGLSQEWMREMLREAGPRYAIHDPATWAQQAQMAADQDWDGLAKWQAELNRGRA